MKKLKKLIATCLIFTLIIGMTSVKMQTNVVAKTVVTTYEAEDSSFCDISEAREINQWVSNASGGQAATIYANEYVVFTIPVEEAGIYDIVLGYAVYGTLEAEISVNDNTPQECSLENLESDNSNGWNTFGTKTLSLNLKEGNNAIKITNVTSNSELFANIDYLRITTKDDSIEAAEGKHEAEYAQIPEGATVKYNADEGTNFSGIGYVEDLNGASISDAKYVTYTVTAEKAGKYLLGVGYATTENTATAFSVNEGEWTEMTLSSTGDWAKTSVQSAQITLNEGINTIRVTGSITGSWIIQDYITIEASEGYVIKTGSELVADGNIKMAGRSMTVGTAVTFDWTASGFEFEYNGAGNITANISASQGASSNYAEIEINVDGTKTRVTVWGNQTVSLAEGLTKGTHTIKVNKVSEAGFGLAQLDSIKYPEDGILQATANKKLKFEVVGDSITCGNGISTNVEDGMASYANLLAEKFDADVNILSVSGRGLMTGWDQENGWALGNTAEMNTIYNYTSYFRDNTEKWDDNQYSPNVIVVNLGNNDLGPATGVTAQAYCDEVVNFSNRLRTAHPDAYILWVYGIFTNRSYSDEIAAAISGLNDDKIFYKYMNAYGGGDSGHPNQEQHKQITEELSAFITEKTGITTEEKPEIIPDAIGRHEAENADYATNNLQSGDYYADCSNSAVIGINAEWTGDFEKNQRYIKQKVNAAKSGTYTLTVAYATPKQIELMAKINDEEWVLFDQADPDTKVLPATSGDGWNVTTTATVNVELTEGVNTIYISGPIVDWTANWTAIYNGDWANTSAVNIDYFELAEYNTPEITKYSVTIDGNVVEEVEEGEIYTMPKMAEVGYIYDGKLYHGGSVITVNSDVEMTSVNEISVKAEKGAGIRIDGRSGIRFQATIDAPEEFLNSEIIEEGMVITAEDIYEGIFNNDLNLLSGSDGKGAKINVVNSGWYNGKIGTYCGSIVDIVESNYIRKFIARAYVTYTYEDGEEVTIYSNMTESRSIQQVAQMIVTGGYVGVESYKDIIDMFAKGK